MECRLKGRWKGRKRKSGEMVNDHNDRKRGHVESMERMKKWNGGGQGGRGQSGK